MTVYKKCVFNSWANFMYSACTRFQSYKQQYFLTLSFDACLMGTITINMAKYCSQLLSFTKQLDLPLVKFSVTWNLAGVVIFEPIFLCWCGCIAMCNVCNLFWPVQRFSCFCQERSLCDMLGKWHVQHGLRVTPSILSVFHIFCHSALFWRHNIDNFWWKCD